MDKVRNAKDTEWNGNKRQEMLTSEYGICQTRKELHGQVGGLYKHSQSRLKLTIIRLLPGVTSHL